MASDPITWTRMFEIEDVPAVSLADRFTLPPFSVLDARGGWWQDRKRQWIDLGLRSIEGRDARTFCGHSELKDAFVEAINRKPDRTAKSVREAIEETGIDEASAKTLAMTDGVSIFDPVLCEMAYRWFCPPGGHVLDPFAGGSVRGIVASVLGRRYTGIDLSPDQVAANRMQSEDMVDRKVYAAEDEPTWIIGDCVDTLERGYSYDDDPEDETAATMLPGCGAEPFADFIWSCPPYHDLERYSDDPRDLSNMPWHEFERVYQRSVDESYRYLNDDRFAGFVVGEIRNRDTGGYRNLVGLTIDAFEQAGFTYYNEIVLVTSVGTLPLRTARQFVGSRKIGKTHQNVLLFVKGDPRAAAKACDATLLADLFPGVEIEPVPDDVEPMAHG